MTTVGVSRLRTRIGGIGFELRSPDGNVAEAVARRYFDFLDDTDDAPAVSIDVVTRNGLWVDPPAPELRGRPWIDMSGDDPCFRVARADFDGEVDLEAGSARLVCQPRALAVDGFLRILCSLILLREGSLLMHAASIADRGRGLVFAGRSGSGKTTVSRLAESRPVLTDETSMVRRNGAGFEVHGNPFSGELDRPGPNRSFPLAALYVLEKADTPATTRLTAAEAVPHILVNTFLHVRGSSLAARALEAATALVASVPVYTLEFPPDPSFWEILE